MSSSDDFDVVVIGTGPGGEGAAMQAVKHGLSVAVVERELEIGGACTHLGTIPSKALRFAIFQLTEAAANRLLPHASVSAVSFPSLLANARSVIARQVAMRQGFYDRNRVTIIPGEASFVDEHTIAVNDATYTARHVIVATGARPYHPPDIDFTHPNIRDSDSILSLESTPRSIAIYGAGVVGCEYASMFRNLGVKVNLINTRDKLLDFLDDEIVDALAYHLRDRGVIIRHEEEFERVEADDSGVTVFLKSGKQIKSDILLWANGRTGNTDKLLLDKVGLEPNSRGQLAVNEQYQTKVPSIYAVGDVIGFPSLASAAYVQGRAASSDFISQSEFTVPTDIPTGIYTTPEISSIGSTEKELTAERIPYEVGHAHFKSLARAQITGRTVGMLKILFHRESLEVLGVHCFGANASEIIHIGQAIMAQKGEANTLRYFIDTTFNYPTMAEAYRVAALNGVNRL